MKDRTTPGWKRLRTKWRHRRYGLNLRRAKRFLGPRPDRWPDSSDDLLLLELIDWYEPSYEPARTADGGTFNLSEPHLLGEIENFRDHVYGDEGTSSAGYYFIDNLQERAEELVRHGLLIGHGFRPGPMAHTTYSLSNAGRTRLYELRAAASRDRTLKFAIAALLATLLADIVALYFVALG